jgi:hypothetical protein
MISGAYGPLNIIFLILGLAVFGIEAWAFVDAMIRPAQAYAYAGKLTKTKWVAITGASAAFGIAVAAYGFGLFISSFAAIFLVAALVAAGVYLTDVRPKVKEYRGGRGSKSNTHMGPYGPW